MIKYCVKLISDYGYKCSRRTSVDAIEGIWPSNNRGFFETTDINQAFNFKTAWEDYVGTSECKYRVKEIRG